MPNPLQKKCDKLYQEIGRLVYTKCMSCLKPIACLHHRCPKSMSSRLRYDFINWIPVCYGCHIQHHSGNPDIQPAFDAKISKEKMDYLNKVRRDIVKTNKSYYEEKFKELTELYDKVKNKKLTKKEKEAFYL